MQPIFRPVGLLFALVLPLLAACSDGGPTEGGSRGLRVVVSGLPSGVAASVTVSGPDAYSRAVSATEELSGLKAGTYLVTAATVTDAGVSYGALLPSQSIVVSGSGVSSATVAYANTASGLTVQMRGLPGAASGTVTVSGPNGFSEVITGGRLLPGLAPGTYTISAGGVVAGDSTYQAKPVAQEVVVSAGAAATADVVYSAVAQRALNLRIETAYLVQAIQTREGAVPLIAGRDAYARVFAVGNQTNSAMPSVRVRLFAGATEAASYLIPAAGPSVGMAVDQGSMSASWNVRIPAALIQPGLRMLVELDPGNGVVEADEQDNSFPASGGPQSLTVHRVAPLRITMVPIHQSSNGRTGNLTAANLDSYLSLTRKLHPVDELEVELRATYTTLSQPLDTGGNVWASVVSELDAVRVAEANPYAYYYGVVNPPYNGGGVVGIANGIPSRTSLGWDRFPDAPETMAHELGHNFGRYHAPCGGAGGSDQEYPHALGLIGVYGMDVETGEIKAPNAFTDIMGYCDTSWWISDYTFLNVLEYRLDNDGPPVSPAQSTLLVWGRMTDDELVLEPAFRIHARPVIPRAGGPYRLEGLDDLGAPLFSYTFTGAETSDGPADASTFAFAIPIDPIRSERLATLRLTGEGRSVVVQAATAAPAARGEPIGPFLGTSVRRERASSVAIRWDDAVHRMILVRDPASGRILSLARGGSVHVPSDASELELVYSDGVRSTTRRVAVER